MKILITGVCGFVGSTIAEFLVECREGVRLVGIDNLMRPGAEFNRRRLQHIGVEFFHGDIRVPSDIGRLPVCDWVIDAAANPSVLAGLSRESASRGLIKHNLLGSTNLLEYCREHKAGLLLLSSSRVYSIGALHSIPLTVQGDHFCVDAGELLPIGLTARGIGAEFSTVAPVSLYGATKLASETLALEYGAAFDFPVWVTRCGVLAGAGQFGTAAQGIFAFWVNAHLRRQSLRYIGFNGTGRQTRDAFHPRDLATLLLAQMETPRRDGQRIYTAGGGADNAMSLAELNAWCDERFGRYAPEVSLEQRAFDVPWVVMDSSDVARDFGWRCETPIRQILNGIAAHAEAHPEWLELSGA